MTVDWSQWSMTDCAANAELCRRYREIVKAESDAALSTRYARLDAAIREAARRMQ